MFKDFKVATFLAYRTIANSSKGTLALMIFVLALAFINIVFVVSLMNGVVTAINGQFINNATANLVLEPQDEPVKKSYIIDATSLTDRLRMLPHVTAATAHYNLIATFAYDKRKDGEPKNGIWEVIGVNPQEEARITGIASHVIAGQYLDSVGSGDIVLGSDIAGGYGAVEEINSLGGVKVGDKLTLSFKNGVTRKYTARGISKVRFLLIDQKAYITRKEAESILGIQDAATQILVKTASTSDEEEVAHEISKIAPNLKLRKWSEYASIVNDMTQSFNLVANIIRVMSLFVATITIFILIYVTVINKKRQIGILRAIGIKEQVIIASYILQAIFYAAAGTTMGLLLMYGLIDPYFARYPLDMPVGDVSLTIISSQMFQGLLGLQLAAVLAGYVPSRMATKENILKAIWG